MNRNRLLILLFIPLFVSAQTLDYDRTVLSERDILGTARYTAMAGAFASLGGDVSAVRDNAAALGVFRHGELAMSFSYNNQSATSGGEKARQQYVCVPNASWVFNFNHTNATKGMLDNNIMLQYARLNSYSRHQYSAPAEWLNTSQTDLMAGLTTGLQENDLLSDNVFDNYNIGWLSIAGYDAGIVNLQGASDTQWESSINGNTRQQLELYESGYTDAYTVAWGANISNKWYIGLSVNVTNTSYSKNVTYIEQFENNQFYSLKSYFSASNVGVNVNGGLIYRPIKQLRFGFAYTTPTWTTITMHNGYKLKSSITATDYSSTDNTYNLDLYTTPMNFTFGAAYQINNLGLLSVEYDLYYLNKKGLNARHWLKLGLEFCIRNNWFVRAGYAYQSSFRKDDEHYCPANTDTRTDTDYRIESGRHYGSVGFGYRMRYFYIDAAYQIRITNSRQYPFYTADYYPVRDMHHRVVFTLAWTYRR